MIRYIPVILLTTAALCTAPSQQPTPIPASDLAPASGAQQAPAPPPMMPVTMEDRLAHAAALYDAYTPAPNTDEDWLPRRINLTITDLHPNTTAVEVTYYPPPRLMSPPITKTFYRAEGLPYIEGVFEIEAPMSVFREVKLYYVEVPYRDPATNVLMIHTEIKIQ